MSMPNFIFASALTILSMSSAFLFAEVQKSAHTKAQTYGFGHIASPAEVAGMDTDVRFDGKGLPPGNGNYSSGKLIFSAQCASCHGVNLEGLREAGTRPLIGTGKTIQDHWPYAPPLFDYIRRAMPFTDPRSLTDNEVYSLAAYILGEAGIFDKQTLLDADSLSAVAMPNRDGFMFDNRPDVISASN